MVLYVIECSKQLGKLAIKSCFESWKDHTRHHTMNVFFLYALLVVVECCLYSNCYKIDEETKKVLKQACEDASREIERTGTLRQLCVVEIQRATQSNNCADSAALYFALPYILFDPLNQFSTIFKNSGVIELLCPLCLRDGLQIRLVNSSKWKTGSTN